MKKLYLFNPDNDLALGNNDVNYMAPKSAKRLANDLAVLPLWYGGEDALILADSAYNRSFVAEVNELFNINAKIVSWSELDGLEDVFLQPWGWNKAMLKSLKIAGLNSKSLITDVMVDSIRSLSHRSAAVKLLQAIPKSNVMCGFSFMMSHIDDLESIASKLGPIVLKAPFSGSGKGLNWCKYDIDTATVNWCKRLLRTQGSVIVEPVFDKVQDLAMEFYLESPTKIKFIGYSSFDTQENGAYTGNLLIPDDELEEEVNYKFFNYGFLQQVREMISPLLLNMLGGSYKGPLGVDMMVCKFNTYPYYRLHPCVEINLRMNMGIVAHSFYNKYVSETSRGTYCVSYSKTNSELIKEVERLKAAHPLKIERGKICSGFFHLNPITPRTQYLAWVLIE